VAFRVKPQRGIKCPVPRGGKALSVVPQSPRHYALFRFCCSSWYFTYLRIFSASSPNHLDRSMRQKRQTHGDKRLRCLLTWASRVMACSAIRCRLPIPRSQRSSPPIKLMDRHILATTKPGDRLARLTLPPDQLPRSIGQTTVFRRQATSAGGKR